MISLIDFDVAPYKLSGVVYGTLLNHKAAIASLGDTVDQPPYKAAPKAPVLYVKPRNTLRASGGEMSVPHSTECIQIGASLGLVFGRVACAVSEEEAMSYLAGYTIVADLSVPHETFYRPSVRFKALDGSCALGPTVVPRGTISNPNHLAVKILVDGKEVHATSTDGMLRPVARLIADVTDFMTLQPGDVLMLGVADGAPCASAGQAVTIEIAEIGKLALSLKKEAA